jgi:hypothetical protein
MAEVPGLRVSATASMQRHFARILVPELAVHSFDEASAAAKVRASPDRQERYVIGQPPVEQEFGSVEAARERPPAFAALWSLRRGFGSARLAQAEAV